MRVLKSCSAPRRCSWQLRFGCLHFRVWLERLIGQRDDLLSQSDSRRRSSLLMRRLCDRSYPGDSAIATELAVVAWFGEIFARSIREFVLVSPTSMCTAELTVDCVVTSSATAAGKARVSTLSVLGRGDGVSGLSTTGARLESSELSGPCGAEIMGSRYCER